jgi:hypothetical protein
VARGQPPSEDATFYRLSTELTGYDEVALRGTGCGETYLHTLRSILPAGLTEALLEAFRRVLADYPHDIELGLRVEILGDPRLGPVARNLVRLWYAGTWYMLPDAWRAAYGASPEDVDHVVSAETYREGLVWEAIGAHPQGAKQQGYGTWGFPPENARPLVGDAEERP